MVAFDVLVFGRGTGNETAHTVAEVDTDTALTVARLSGQSCFDCGHNSSNRSPLTDGSATGPRHSEFHVDAVECHADTILGGCTESRDVAVSLSATE